jgi:hypothetical protein
VTDDLIEAQQRAKQQGKIRFAGISTHGGQTQLLPWMAKKGAFDVVLAAYNFTMDRAMDAAIEEASKAGTGVVAMKVMAGGFRKVQAGDPLYTKFKKERTMLAALKWVLKNSRVSTTIPGITDIDQLEENLKAMAEPYSPDDDKLLAQRLEQIGPLYCRMCGGCEGACAKGLPVADLLRYLTYADGYGQFSLGREHFLALPPEVTSVRCNDCATCTVSCPFGVKVSSCLARAQELFT